MHYCTGKQNYLQLILVKTKWQIKGILSTTIVIFSYSKLLSFSVLTFIKWRLTPSYAAKDTIFWQKRSKTIIIGIIVQDNKNSNLFIWPSMWTCLEHAHCLETISNMWILGKRESVNAWKKSSKWNLCRIYVGDQLDRWNELKKCYASKLALKWQRFCLIGKPNMFFPFFLNRFSYFMNLWWCLWSFSVDIIQYM